MRGEKGFKYQRREKLLEARRLRKARRNPVEFGTYMADQFRRMSTAKLQSYLGSGGSREHLARTEIKRRHR